MEWQPCFKKVDLFSFYLVLLLSQVLVARSFPIFRNSPQNFATRECCELPVFAYSPLEKSLYEKFLAPLFIRRTRGFVLQAHAQSNILERDSILHLPLEEIPITLQRIFQGSEENRTIATEGYITHRRSFGSALAFIDLVGTNVEKGYPQPLQALLKRQAYHHDRSKSIFSSMLKSLHPGTKVAIEGFASPTQNPGEVVLLVSHVRFLKSSRNPEHVKGMLQRLRLFLDSDGADDKKNGLAVEEFDNVFGPKVNSNKLKDFLSGDIDAEALFGGDDDEARRNGLEANVKKNRKIAFTKMARLIVNNLPEDKHYPSIILNSKGAAVNKGGDGRNQSSSHYMILPAAPQGVKTVPSTVMEMILEHSTENKDDISENLSPFNQLFEDTVSGGERNAEKDVKLLTVSAWIQNRRRFRGEGDSSITVLELVEEPESVDEISDHQNRLKCVLHPLSLFKGENDKPGDVLPSDAYGNLLSKSSKVLVQGYYATGDDKRPTLWVTKARLQRCTWRPATIKYFLDLISGSDDSGSFSFDREEIGDALAIGHTEASDLVEDCKNFDGTERQWRAAEISRKLQDSTSRLGRFTDEMKSVLERNSSAREEYPLEHIEYEGYSTTSNKLNSIPTRRRNDYLRKSSEGSRWRGKKKPQLEIIGQQVKEVVQSHPDFKFRPLNILDVGGGRGYLSNYLSIVLGKDIANVHVIDIDSSAVRNGQIDAQRRGLNVRFGVGDASRSSNIANLLDGDNGMNEKYDIVVALHACGALSDVALGHACVNQASFVITPCCFRSNSFLRVSIPCSKNDLVQQELVSPSQWLGMEEEDMVALTLAAEIQGDRTVAGEAIHTLCALRAKAVKRNAKDFGLRNIDIQVKTFPIGFSTRNYCIVGRLY